MGRELKYYVIDPLKLRRTLEQISISEVKLNTFRPFKPFNQASAEEVDAAPYVAMATPAQKQTALLGIGQVIDAVKLLGSAWICCSDLESAYP